MIYGRYHSKPFECGDGIRHEPGWYRWTEGQFQITLEEVEVPRRFRNSVDRELLGVDEIKPAI